MTDVLRRVRNALAFGTTTRPVVVKNGIPHVQVRLTPIEVMDLPLVEQRGIGASLPVGTPIVAAFHAGDRSNGVVLGSTAPSARPPMGGPEDACLYGYGYTVIIRADGVHILGAPDVYVEGNLHVGADLIVRGAVRSGDGTGDSINLQSHTHPSNGSPPSPGS